MKAKEILAIGVIAGVGSGLGVLAANHFSQKPVTGRVVQVNNESSFTLTHFFAKYHNDRGQWGEDLLGEDIVLQPGEKTAINLDDHSRNCRYDLMVQLKTKEKVTQKNVDLCPSLWNLWNGRKVWNVGITTNEIK